MAIGASSPSRGLALAVGLFFFSRPSVDEMQSSSLCKSPFVLSLSLALTTSFVPLQQLFSCLHLCEHLPLGCPQTPRPLATIGNSGSSQTEHPC